MKRLATGGRIDRTRTFAFTFDGHRLEGYAGDTLASALLANEIDIVSRSFKFHRPRGIFTAGPEEPNALVSIGAGARLEPNVRATAVRLCDGLVARSQAGWPSVQFSVGRVFDWLHPVLPAGFYNKTFMWPSWRPYSPLIRRAAGHAPAPQQPDPDAYEAVNATCDVLVVGGGASGMRAALDAAVDNSRIILVEQDWELGGSLLSRRTRGGEDAAALRDRLVDQLAREARVTVLTRTTAVGVYDHGVVTLHERLDDPLDSRVDADSAGHAAAQCRERHCRVRARQVVLATGRIEQPLVFPGNDRPGIMLATAVRTYIQRYAVLPAKRFVIFTNNDEAYDVAAAILEAGAEIAAIVDVREHDTARQLPGIRNVPVLRGARIVDTNGTPLKGVHVRNAGVDLHIECDGLAVSGGHSPALQLLAQAGGKLGFDRGQGCLIPQYIPRGISVAGSAAGGGATVVGNLNGAGPEDVTTKRAWVDLAHDVTVADLELSVRENIISVEHLKRYTTTGMAPDQGKTSNLNALVMLAARTGRTVDATGTTTSRPPFMPVTLGAIAGGRRGYFRSTPRLLPSHDEQVHIEARLESLGGWMRPVCYPRAGEQEHAAVLREISAVRNRAGLFEASPIGKILVRGPDAAQFLDFIYANTISTLGVGRARYGLMLNEQGVIIDDGVAARLGESEFWISTTSAGAARISSWMDEWLQCELIDLRVAVTPVTTQWAALSLSGPCARDVLQQLPCSIDLAPAAFPHLNVREGTLCDVPCKILRVSFSGELTYEIYVPASCGQSLWRLLMSAGAEFGIAPYGTEALQALRIEKGFIHVGADTDGTTVPADVGFGAIVARKSSDFVGRRSLALPENVRADRRQLVGLRAEHSGGTLLAGAHIVRPGSTSGVRHSEGYVTSACFSPTLGEYIALGMIERGRSRHGERVTLFSTGTTVTARVVDPVFFDRPGARIHA